MKFTQKESVPRSRAAPSSGPRGRRAGCEASTRGVRAGSATVTATAAEEKLSTSPARGGARERSSRGPGGVRRRPRGTRHHGGRPASHETSRNRAPGESRCRLALLISTASPRPPPDGRAPATHARGAVSRAERDSFPEAGEHQRAAPHNCSIRVGEQPSWRRNRASCEASAVAGLQLGVITLMVTTGTGRSDSSQSSAGPIGDEAELPSASNEHGPPNSARARRRPERAPAPTRRPRQRARECGPAAGLPVRLMRHHRTAG